MEGTSLHHILGLTPRVQERPVNFFGQAKTLPTFDALIVAFSMGELRETGGAWPSWLGFFCFKDCPQQLRQLNNVHSNTPRLIERQHLSYVGLGLCVSRIDVAKRSSGRFSSGPQSSWGWVWVRGLGEPDFLF